MAKKPPRSGGRITPKGTRPVEGNRTRTDRDGPKIDHRPVDRTDPSHGRPGSGPQGPTRAGHHRGQR